MQFLIIKSVYGLFVISLFIFIFRKTLGNPQKMFLNKIPPVEKVAFFKV